MNIKTKNIGDKVWALHERTKNKQCSLCKANHFDRMYWLTEQYKINFIETKTDSESTEIGYYEKGGWKFGDLFNTRKEAQAECDKRNKEY